MLKAKPGKEVVLKVRNEIGLLAQIAHVIADHGVNVLAASAWVEHENGIVHLVTEDNLRVLEALRAKAYSPREADVVLVELPHKPGLLRHVTDCLAREGVDIHHLYASATPAGNASLVVFACANNDRAVVLLNS
jgi:hypothetical protein